MKICLGDQNSFITDINSGFWMCIIMLIGIFPLSLFKEVNVLRYICMAGVGVTFYIAIILSIEPFTMLHGRSFIDNIKLVKLWDTL